MNTPVLDEVIDNLIQLDEKNFINFKHLDELIKEYSYIKNLIKLNTIVPQIDSNQQETPVLWDSTPDNPCWVIDDCGEKRILLTDLGVNARYRYILVEDENEHDFLNGNTFDWCVSSEATPYSPKDSTTLIEVKKDEVEKIFEFLKQIRS
jgi:hypothetical protein